jgi:PucR family transcriptional regulator, purine catabolism regulatory protein
MKLAHALAEGPLSAAQVVAAAGHVEKDISWVQVVDHPDIESWVKQGHLLLSTGYSWPKDPEAARHIVERLAAKGVCGVVLAVPHFLDHFPGTSIEAAERVGLPLMEIPWEVPFSEITQAVHRELVDQQAHALARSEQIHRELTEAAVSGHSLHDVACVLGRVLNRRVSILDADGSVLGLSTGAQQDTTIEATDVYRALKEGRGLAQVDATSHPVRLQVLATSTAALPAHRLAVYAARVRTDRVGYVVVQEGDDPLSALDLRAIEHAGTVTALQISHQRELSMQEARLGYALVASLIEGRFEPKPQTLERAQLLGWAQETRYRLCTVLLDEPNPLTREGFAKREAFAVRAAHGLESRGVKPLMSLSANQVHILVPEGLEVDAWWAEFQPTRMAVGVSQVQTGVDGMATAGRETAELIEHLLPGRVHHFAQMLFPRVMRGDEDARRVFVARLLGRLDDGKRGQHLLETALALADEGFHLQRSAERLGVHISTLRYRLDKLAEHTGLDLESVDGRFQLQMAARLYLMAQ